MTPDTFAAGIEAAAQIADELIAQWKDTDPSGLSRSAVRIMQIRIRNLKREQQG